MPNSPADEQRINAIRFLAVDAVQKANSGHPGLPMGCAALAYTLFTRHLRFNPKDPHWFNRDRFVLSAGHGSMLLYALLYLTGYDLTLDELKNFRQFDRRRRATRNSAGRPAWKRPPGRSARGSATPSAWRSPKHTSRPSTTARSGHRRPLHVLPLRRRRHDGRHQPGIDLAGRPPEARQTDLLLRRQPRLARRADRRHLDRRSDRPVRFGRLAHAIRRRRPRQRRRHDRSSDPSRQERHRPPVDHRGAHAHRLRLAAPRHVSARTASRSAPRTSRRSKEELGWPLEPAFFVPDDVLASSIAKPSAKGEDLEEAWQTLYDAWKARQRRPRARSSNACSPASFRPICRGRRSTHRTAASPRAMPAAP